MPNVSNYRDWHQAATEKVSEIIRALALSEMGIIWIFHKEIEDIIDGKKVINYELPEGLALPLLLVIIGLFFDLLQFFYKSVLFHCFYRYYEKKYSIKQQESNHIDFHPAWNKISYFLFYSKTLLKLGT